MSSRPNRKPDSTKANPVEDLCAKLEAALLDQIARAAMGHAEIAESAAHAQDALDHLIEKVTARRVNAVSLGEETKDHLRKLTATLADVDDGAEARERLEQLEQKFTERTDEISASKDRIAHLEKIVLELEESLDETESRAEEFDSARKRVKELEKIVKGHGESAEKAEDMVAKFQSDIEERSEAVKWSQQRIEELQKESSEALACSEEAEKTIHSLEKSLGEKERDLEAAQDRSTELAKKLSDTAAHVDFIEHELADHASDMETAKKSVSEIEMLENELREAKEAHRATESKAADQEEALRESLQNAQSEIGELVENLEETNSEKLKLEQVKKLMTAERDRADRLEEQLRRETDKATESALAEQLAQALRERERQQKELIDLRREVEELRKLNLEQVKEVGKGDSAKRDKRRTARKTASTRRTDGKALMGEILIEAGVISQKQLKAALDYQRKNPNKLLGAVLVEKKYASEDVVAQALALQRNIEFVRLNESVVQSDAIKLIDGKLAELHRCVPLRVDDGKLVLAMVNPLDLVAIEDVERVTGLLVEPVAATGTEIIATIRRKYRR